MKTFGKELADVRTYVDKMQKNLNYIKENNDEELSKEFISDMQKKLESVQEAVEVIKKNGLDTSLTLSRIADRIKRNKKKVVENRGVKAKEGVKIKSADIKPME